MSTSPYIVDVAFDEGVYSPGAKKYFYEAGTSTPLDTYSDEALTTSNANPVVADGEGQFGAIYLKTDQSYKMILTDADDNTILTRDNINAVVSVGDSRINLINRLGMTPLYYGALGDGVANEAAQVQAAIDAAEAAGTYVVDLLGLTYRCDSALTLHSGVKIKNGTLNFTNHTGAEHIIIRGTQGASVALSSNLTAGASFLSTADTSTAAADQWIHVGDTSDWDTGGVADQGILMKVRSIVANTSIYMHGRFPLTLTTANGATWTPLTMIEDVILEDMTIISGTDSGTTTVVVDAAERVRIRNVKFDGVPATAVEMRLAHDVIVEDCQFGPNNVASTVGVAVWECSKNITIRNNTLYDLSTGIDVGAQVSGGLEGVCSHITIEGNKIYGCTSKGVYVREAASQVKIHFNCIEGYDGSNTDEGIDYEGGDGSIIGNEIYQTHSVAILVDSELDSTAASFYQKVCIRVERNRIFECSSTGAAIQFACDQATDFYICGNSIFGGAGVGILSGGGIFSDVHINGNTIGDCEKDCIQLENTSSVNWLSISDNSLREVGGDSCIECDINVTGQAVISNNRCQKGDDTSPNINVNATETSGDFSFGGNTLSNGTYGIVIGSHGEAVHFGNVFAGMATGDTSGSFDTFVSS